MKKYILSLSGGKDSTYLLYKILKLGLPLDEIIHADVGYEDKAMNTHMDNLQDYVFEEYGRSIVILKNNKPIEEFMTERTKRGKHKGIIRGFPLRFSFCWISRDYKIKLLEKFVKDYKKENDCEVIQYLGFAIDEKNPSRQKKIKEYLADKKSFIEKEKTMYPLVDLNITEEECREGIKKIGLYTSVHFESNRSGCWFCPKAKKEVRLKDIAKDPIRVKKIEEWINISGREIFTDLTLEEIKEYCLHKIN